jgi:hypothetical protein
MAPNVARDSDAADAADSRANFLDGRHEGKRKKDSPEHAVAELCTDLRIGRDPTRIVIRRACNQARAQLPENFFDPRTFTFPGGSPLVLIGNRCTHNQTLLNHPKSTTAE